MDNIDSTQSISRIDMNCPCCDSKGMSVFFQLKDVPAHSILLMPTRETALNHPRGDIFLGLCRKCGFISNVAFEPRLLEYSSQHEDRQGFSPTFNASARKLAARLIEEYDLHNKNICEIGYSKGEFLTLLCKLGRNRGVGIAPGYRSNHSKSGVNYQIRFIKDTFSSKHSDYIGDFVVCKITLEHVFNVAEFVNTVREAIGNRADTIVFFQVPDVKRILGDCIFEDIFYEHCSYFSRTSLKYLFHQCGFEILRLSTAYNNQYLVLEAKPITEKVHFQPTPETDVKTLESDIMIFRERYQKKIRNWQFKFNEYRQKGRRVVIWGGGSKAVAFLTTPDIQADIEYVVDINPYKHCTFMAGTGQEIVSPEFLREYKPDVVLVMNPIYREEIQRELSKMGLTSELVTGIAPGG